MSRVGSAAASRRLRDRLYLIGFAPQPKPDAIMTKRALELFDGGFNCAEAVTLATAERLGIKNDLLPRAATAFGGGLGRTNSVCGALTGGALVLSIVHGRTTQSDDRTVLIKKVQELVAGFRSRFGSDNCLALTGLDFNDPGAMVDYRERVHAQCQSYVGHVVQALGELLPSEQGGEPGAQPKA